jgi:hypothetical protein
MKRTALARKNSSSSASPKTEQGRRRLRSRFVVCISNRNYAASLERRKIYRRIPDSEARKHGLIRVVDESGRGYLYPERYFTPIAVPRAAARTFPTTG